MSAETIGSVEVTRTPERDGHGVRAFAGPGVTLDLNLVDWKDLGEPGALLISASIERDPLEPWRARFRSTKRGTPEREAVGRDFREWYVSHLAEASAALLEEPNA